MNLKIKDLLLLFAITALFLFGSCEKDLYEEPIQQNHKKNQSKTLTGAEALRIAKKLNGVLKNNNSSLDIGEARILSSVGTIRFDEIREVIDTLGKVNYTFRVDHPESSNEKFFNLVLQEKNEESTVKLFEYTMTPEFAQQYKQTLSLVNYYGTVKSTTIESENPCPENDFLVIVGPDPNSTSGGSSSNGSGGGPGGGNPNSGGAGGPIGGPGNTGGGTPWGNIILNVSIAAESPEEWIQVSQSPRYWRLAVQNNTGFGPEEPCSNELIIGVLNPIDNCSKSFLDGLNYGQKLWFYNQQTLNTPIFSEILNYVSGDGNNCDNEKKSFASDVITQCIQKPYFTSMKPFLIEAKINDDNLNPCVKQIFSDLKNTNNIDIAAILQKLDNPNSIYNTTFSMQTVLPGATAITDWEYDAQNNMIPYNYTIKIKSSYANQATQLSISCTIIHEIIHAYFLSLIDDCHIANNCVILQTFPQLWDFYVLHKNNGILTNGIQQHEEMAELYVNTIASALEQYHTGNSVSSTTPQQIYKDLAWAGLLGTAVFDALPDEDKARIVARTHAERINSPIVNSYNNQTVNPTGVPCN